MASQYLTTTAFRGLTLAPSSYVDIIEANDDGWTQRRLDYWASWIDSRLRKRYAVPFGDPPPATITGWLEAIVTFETYLKRGIDPTDRQVDEMKQRHDTAKAEIREAATAIDNAFELPLRADTTADGTSKAGALGYSEQSPYTFTIVQAEAAQDEDTSGVGS